MRGIALLFAAGFLAVSAFAFVALEDAETVESYAWDARWSAYDADLGGYWWGARHTNILERIEAEKHFDLVLIGDSITHRWERHGAAAYVDVTNRLSVLNLGFGADSANNCLWRPRNGELDGYTAKAFQIMIGTNNSGSWKTNNTAMVVRQCLREIRSRHPDAKILLCAILPRGAVSGTNTNRVHIAAVNAMLQPLGDDKRLVWTDWSRLFVHSDGSMNSAFVGDGLHPNASGYARWRNAALPVWRKVAGKDSGSVTEATIAAQVDAIAQNTDFNYTLVSGETTNVWVGPVTGGSWNDGANWETGVEPTNHVYAVFTNGVTTTATKGFGATGIIVQKGAGAVTVGAPSTWESSALTLRYNQGLPSLINLSGERLTIDVMLKFNNGWGRAAVLPNVAYKRKITESGSSNGFTFLAGAPGAADATNTSSIESAADFGGNAVLIEADHIVRVSGSKASFKTTGQLTVNGKLIVENGATFDVADINAASTGTIITNGVTVIPPPEPETAWYANATQWGAGWSSDDWTTKSWTNGVGTAETGIQASHCYRLDGAGKAIRLNTPKGSTTERTITFPGVALWCLNGAANALAYLALKGLTNTISDLRLGDCGGLSFNNWDVNKKYGQFLEGTITVSANDSTAYVLGDNAQATNTISAALVGTGRLTFRPTDSKAVHCVNLTGDNYGYTGKMIFAGHGARTNRTVVMVSRVQNLGGPPAVDTADAIVLDNAKLVVTGDIRLNAKRKMTICGDSEIEVAEGCTFLVDSRITKEAGATLAVTRKGTFQRERAGLCITFH